MQQRNLRNFYKVIIPIIAVLLVFLVVIVALTYKKEKEYRAEQARISESQALAEITTTVTVPEGYTVTQIAQLLEEKDVCSKSEFLSYVKNPPKDVLDKLGLKDVSDKIFALEGYIFPDTYEFYKNEKAEIVVAKFIDNFLVKVTDEMYEKANNMGYTMDEIITIASIVQKEAGLIEENPKVASVIYNRLNDGMQIQCDVTSNYLKKYVEPHVDEYSEEYENKYDTFKCIALPSGAICNPGVECIKAALDPAETEYFFFVTDSKDVTKFYFSKTYNEHISNCHIAGYTGY